jgi:hypothetical protein
MEGAEDTAREAISMHPLWEEYAATISLQYQRPWPNLPLQV